MNKVDLFDWQPDQLIEDWLALQCCKGLGLKKLRKLAYLCNHDFYRLRSLSQSDFIKLGIVASSIKQLQRENQSHIENSLNWLVSSNLNFILPINHPNYPKQLLEIANPPPLLYGTGNIQKLSEPQIAIVGSRNHSPAGGKFAYEMAGELVRSGWGVTSGLALGIDTHGHNGALDANGSTVAVMATGIDQVYPKRNRDLAKRIIDDDGCVITEMLFGAGPKKESFPRRNRIVSGLSKGVLVVEAAIKSGSLISAKYALEQNREVFAVPGSVYNINSRGCHQLIKQGAKLTEQVSDINEEFPNIVQLVTNSETIQSEKNSNLCLATDKLLASVGFEATSVDVVAQRSGLPVTVVMSELLEYELRGLVATVSGGYIRLGE